MKVSGAKPSAEPPFPAKIVSKAALNPRTDSDLRPRKPARRKPRTPGVGRIRRAGASAGRRSRPETPLLKWKVGKGDDAIDVAAAAAEGIEDEVTGGGDRRRRRKEAAPVVSARKLAAGLWRLQMPETAASVGRGGGEKRWNEKLGFEHEIGHEGMPFHHHRNDKVNGFEAKEYLQSPSSSSRNGYPCKAKPSFRFSNSAMEGVTKWDPVSLKTSDDARMIYREMKVLDHQVSAVSVVAALETELEQAQSRIHDLEAERRSSKKKLEHFLRKLDEDKATWRSREHEKVRMFIDDLKSELNRERKTRQRVEIVNSKLVNELADAKLSTKRLLQDYDKERKSRELIEEVCDELAKEIGEDKAEAEELKRESARMREELDEERKMLQMAEVWREERVQMKLVDAKVALEEKHSYMSKLVSELERYLTLDAKEIGEAELLRKAVASVRIQDVVEKEFAYVPPNPDDIFSVFEEVNEREIAVEAYSPASQPSSRIHTVSPEMVNRCRADMLAAEDEDESGWETVSHAEDHGSSFGSVPSVNKWDDDDVGAEETPRLKKGSSVTKLWRSCPNNNEESFKIISVEGVSNMSPEKGGGGGGISPSDLPGQWSSPESGNGRHARGMNRCIPRAGQKHSLKAKLLEARIESQKVQLRHVLRQKY